MINNCKIHDGFHSCYCSKELSENFKVIRDNNKVLGIVDIKLLDQKREKILSKTTLNEEDLNELKKINEVVNKVWISEQFWDSDAKAMHLIHQAANFIKDKNIGE